MTYNVFGGTLNLTQLDCAICITTSEITRDRCDYCDKWWSTINLERDPHVASVISRFIKIGQKA